MYLLNFSLTVFCFIWFYLVLFLPVFVVGLLVLSMCIEALVSGVLCGVFISLFPVTFIMGRTSKDSNLPNVPLLEGHEDASLAV
jgi:Na+/proline symporter